ncbi:MAG: HEAT repeat domain-containing protein, partial [Planctomycetales bacterium]|nr:HEAT repeat domain-containing protein [Planctomycetales bacterium]
SRKLVNGTPVPQRHDAEDKHQFSKVAGESPPSNISHPAGTGRLPTALERFAFASSINTSQAQHSVIDDAALDRIVAHVADDVSVDPLEELSKLTFDPLEIERRLLLRLRQLPCASASETDARLTTERIATLRLLQHCGSWASAPLAIDATSDRRLRPQAIATLLQIVSPAHHLEIVASVESSEVRREIFGVLLARSDESSFRSFLTFVAAPAFQAEAVEAAKIARTFPLELALAALDDPEQALRNAAVRTLGAVKSPEATQRLIERVTTQPGDSPAAWAALLICRDERAEEFFDYAAWQPELLGHLNRARLQIARFPF